MQNLSENVAVLAAKAGTANSTPLVTSYVSAQYTPKITLFAVLADMAAETIDIAIYQATDTGGTSAKLAKAATQLAAHATNNDNKIVVVEVDASDLDLAGGFYYVAGRCVTGGATGGVVGLTLLGSQTRYKPASLVDSASVVEIKS